jgi:hypothetical protein
VCISGCRFHRLEFTTFVHSKSKFFPGHQAFISLQISGSQTKQQKALEIPLTKCRSVQLWMMRWREEILMPLPAKQSRTKLCEWQLSLARAVQHPGVFCKNSGLKTNIFRRHLRRLNSHEDCSLKGEQKDTIFAARKSCVPARGEGSQIGHFSDLQMTTFGAPFTSPDSLIISRVPSRKKCHFRAIKNARMLNCSGIRLVTPRTPSS